MDPDIIDLLNRSLGSVLLLLGPMTLALFLVGVVVSLLQAFTGIKEIAVSYALKLVAAALVLGLMADAYWTEMADMLRQALGV